MENCVSHDGFYDDWDNPLDAEGNPFMPGKRKCGYRDCVNPKHVEGYKKPQKIYGVNGEQHFNEIYSREVIDQVIKLGLMATAKQSTCRVDGCTNPHASRNLCTAHYGVFRRKQRQAIKKQPHFSLADFPQLPPPTARADRRSATSNAECLMAYCDVRAARRGLCHKHYSYYWKLTKAN